MRGLINFNIRILFFISYLSCLLCLSCLMSACHRANTAQISSEWQIFDYPDMNGTAYIIFKNNKVKGIICANVAGIQGRVNLSHECTKEQYDALRERFESFGARYLGKTDKPDLTDYPDLSAYLTFIMSSDEMHELWQNLGLEEKEE